MIEYVQTQPLFLLRSQAEAFRDFAQDWMRQHDTDADVELWVAMRYILTQVDEAKVREVAES